MKKIFLCLLFILSLNSLFCKSLIEVFDVPFDADINMAVKVLKSNGFVLDNITHNDISEDYYKTIIDFVPKTEIVFNTLKINRLTIFFSNGKNPYFLINSFCTNYNEFEKSLYDEYPNITLSKDYNGDACYVDKYTKAKIALIMEYDRRYLYNNSDLMFFISKR